MTREKDKHYLEIIGSFRFGQVVYTHETIKDLVPHKMGNFIELFILDNINLLQKHGLTLDKLKQLNYGKSLDITPGKEIRVA
jgi:hypothetical protein